MPVIENDGFAYAALRDDGSGRAKQLLWFSAPPASELIADGYVRLELADYNEWNANIHTRAWLNNELAVVDTDEVWAVPAYVVVQRIAAAGKLRYCLQALKADAALVDMTDAEITLRERWNKASELYSNDADVIHLLTAVGLDPAAILAKA